MHKTARALSAATLAALTWVAFGAEPPQLKEGLWSIHSHDVESPAHKTTDFTSTLCRSHASDRQAHENASNMTDCATVRESLHGNEYTIESRCKLRGSIVESKSTTHFSGNATHTEVHVTYTPALNGVTESTLVQDQKYLGKCPAGAESGDLMLPNGSVQHLGRPQSSAEPHP
jgi:hypothetical protein